MKLLKILFLALLLILPLSICLIAGSMVMVVSNVVEKIEELNKTDHITGQIEKIECWLVEKDKVIHNGNGFKITTPVQERMKITFTDGRLKEFIGVSREPIPTNTEVVIIFIPKYNVFVKFMTLDEFQKTNEFSE